MNEEWDEEIENAAVRIVVACELPYRGEQETGDRAGILERYEKLSKMGLSFGDAAKLARIEFVKEVLRGIVSEAGGFNG